MFPCVSFYEEVLAAKTKEVAAPVLVAANCLLPSALLAGRAWTAGLLRYVEPGRCNLMRPRACA